MAKQSSIWAQGQHWFGKWVCSVSIECSVTENFSINPAFFDRLISKSERTFKNDRTTTVATAVLDGRQVVVKRYNARNLWHYFKRAFRKTRAERCWEMSLEYQGAGLLVAEPLIMFERRFGPIRLNAFFVNNYVQAPELLGELPRLSIEDQRRVAEVFGQCLHLMRDNYLSHGDMKASNLLWSDDGLYFIDLDAAKKHGSMSAWKKAMRRDLRRFMKNWDGHPEISKLFEPLLREMEEFINDGQNTI